MLSCRKSSDWVYWKYLEPSILPSKEPGLAIVRNSRWCKTVRKGSKKLWMNKRMNTWSRKHNWSGLDTWLTNKELILQKPQLSKKSFYSASHILIQENWYMIHYTPSNASVSLIDNCVSTLWLTSPKRKKPFSALAFQPKTFRIASSYYYQFSYSKIW